MKTISLKLILVVYLAQIVFGGQETTITVKFNESQIVGKIEKSLDGKNVKVFRGIPYAEPPVGDLRFKRPVPLKNVAQSYDAFNWPRLCYQNLSFSPGIDYQNKNLSEDCLYLNIWTPTNASADSPLKAVIVYLHGGNFMVGPSNWTMIGGSVIATKGDVIFININYRLGIFGFLYTGTDDAPGNVGLWDQVLAMEWVRDNIEHFGGDPKRVTLMGGSWSVSLHIYSPISHNLFRNAILQSGAVTNNMFQGLPRDHVKKWLKSVQDIPCHGNQSIQMTDKFNETIIQCLRDADAMTLINITEKMLLNNFGLSGALVVVDGKLIPKKPSNILREGLYNQEINLLFGTSIDEGSFLLAANPKNFTLSEAKQRLEDLISDISQRFEINGKDVSNLYFNGFSDKNTFDELRQTIGKAIADYFISCPTIVFGKEIYRNSNRKANS